MQDSRRYYSLDALRGVMMMLGVVIHGSMLYLATPVQGISLPTDRSTSFFFDIITYFIHSFRMPLFFILAGFFSSLLVEKRGLRGTFINRGKRILGPLLAAVVTVLPLSLLFIGSSFVYARFGTHQLIPDRQQIEILTEEMRTMGIGGEPTILHLWFLQYLLYFYLTIPVCSLIVRLSGFVRAGVDSLLEAPAVILLFGLITGLILWPYRGGMIFRDVLYITPGLSVLIYYWLFYLLGYVFHHHRGILVTFRECIVTTGIASIFLFPASIYTGVLDAADGQSSLFMHTVTVLLHGFCTWTLIYFLMGVFLRYFDTDSPWVLYLSQSSYWVYLVHMPIVSIAAWWLLPYDLHAYVKFSLVVVFTVLLCFVSYHYMVQRTWISVFLNGRRFDLDWPWLVKLRPQEG